ncbi:sigma-70 family RNA polymerase sigma factor [Colwellia sp. UCD-KL20]|uniref:RNA polymerase sigma factor n=1 Tax=Colwellia sp. UCD-KL20 TaxID=1917165 RepID=UPI0009714851|nr:sigma-70 family RNA polymerase sigma factor [Colwellia sp. UCD-KL20]
MILNDDSILIKKACNGDISAFSELVKIYEKDIRAYLAVRLFNVHEADDLAQEAFIIAFRKIKEFEQSKPFRPWLRGIAFNLLKNYWRKHTEIAVGADVELDLLINEEINLQYAEQNESAAAIALETCVENLDDNFKKLIHQHYHFGFSIAELTRQYSVGHSTMTMRLYRIRERLKDCIKGKLSKEIYD